MDQIHYQKIQNYNSRKTKNNNIIYSIFEVGNFLNNSKCFFNYLKLYKLLKKYLNN